MAPATIRDPSGLNKTSKTGDWRMKSVRGAPEKASQTRATPMSSGATTMPAPVTRRRPSGLNRADVTGFGWTSGAVSGSPSIAFQIRAVWS